MRKKWGVGNRSFRVCVLHLPPPPPPQQRLTQAHFEADSLALCNQCKCSAASAHFILLPKSIEKTASKDLHISSMSIELERARARKAFLNGAAIKERLCNNLELLLLLLMLLLVCPLLVLEVYTNLTNAGHRKTRNMKKWANSLTCSFASCNASPTPNANFFCHYSVPSGAEKSPNPALKKSRCSSTPWS